MAPDAEDPVQRPRFGRGSVDGLFLIGVGALRVVNQLLQPQERVAAPKGKVPPGID